MNRRQFLQKAGVAAAIASVSPTLIFARPRDEHQITILHTNDWHSRIDPFPMDGGRYQGLGGAAARAGMINRIRSQKENVLLLDAGDIFQGTPYFNYYKGDPEITLMNEMKYDAVTIGNHDFDAGIDGLSRQIDRAQFPFINCNYNFENTPVNGKVLPYKVFEKGKLRIGVLGVGIRLKGLVPEALYGDTLYNDPIDCANVSAEHLKIKERCHLVVCLSHLGLEYNTEKISDVILARKSSNIDVIIGGHTHTFLSNPRSVINIEKKPVMVLQAGWGGIMLGRLDAVHHCKAKATRVTYTSDKVSK